MTDELEQQTVEQPTPSPPVDPGEPQPENFDDYNKFVIALADYKADVKLAEYARAQRERARDESDAAMKVLEQGVAKGAAEGVREALVDEEPPIRLPEDYEDEKEAEEERLWQAIDRGTRLLGEQSWDKAPFWNDEKVQKKDVPRVLHRYNRDARAEFLILPKLDPESGELAEIRPSNMIHVRLPKDVQERWQRLTYLYAPPGITNEGLFRRGHDILRGMGYGGEAKPTFFYPQPEQPKEKKGSKDPEKMSQQEFEAWRKSHGARRF